MNKDKHTQLFHRVLTIDVGDNTGWAYWCKEYTWNGVYPLPHRYGQFNRIKKDETLEKDLINQTQGFIEMLDSINPKPKLCILEGVGLWSNDLRSLTSATRGNLFKLAYMVGMYARICTFYQIEFRIIQAREWKGQMNNPMVMQRVSRMTGITVKKNYQHMVDAIGMGLSLMGYWEVSPQKIQKTKRYKVNE